VSLLQDLEFVREYYSTRRQLNGTAMSIYEIWEKGCAFADSITPSTYDPAYRLHITGKLLSLTRSGNTAFSIGCGNGFIEAELVRRGRSVRAIDCNEEAVRLTAAKGVQAFEADFFDLPPATMWDVDLVYADGLLGHVFEPAGELTRFMDKLRDLTLRRGTWIVVSNDAPRDPEASFSPHDRLREFWFLSKSYLSKALSEAGFDIVESYYFTYARPLSGLRNRTICIARWADRDR
jgi:SAM-dependent methyltransferase